jgi:hypothetical protein
MKANEPKTKKEPGFFDEVISTFSNNNSLLSSKKIERFIVFNCFLVLTFYYIFINIDEIDARSFIEIIGVWLFYGGYNSFMTLRDKKLSSQNNNSDSQ